MQQIFKWDEKEKGLIVKRKPIYHNETMVDETIDVLLHYNLSDFKNRKSMYKKILEDVEILRNRLIETQKKEEKEKDKR